MSTWHESIEWLFNSRKYVRHVYVRNGEFYLNVACRACECEVNVNLQSMHVNVK